MQTARFVAGAADPARLPQLRYPEVAFAGRSNVGKSSLINRLVGQRALARVSKTPGRTQQINFFLIDDRLTIVDLPGYGFARVPLAVKSRWKHLVEGYINTSRNLRGVIVLVDLRRGIEADDQALLDYLQARDIPAVIVATKCDKLAYGERQRAAQALAARRAQLPLLLCSSASGAGMEQLSGEVERLCHAQPVRAAIGNMRS